LVFSTLHTNNAATCLPRLLDMGVEPFLIASTVRVVIGQRLVRRLCVDCRQPFAPDATVMKSIEKIFNLTGNGGIKHFHELEEQALADGIGAPVATKDGKGKETGELSTSASTITRLWKAKDDGCEHCNHTGYKGRIGIYEVLSNTTSIQKMIVANGTSEDISKAAVEENMLSMQLDGFVKALRGQTTIEEVMRVTAQE
jgi:type IV pilus assembly protein PilB